MAALTCFFIGFRTDFVTSVRVSVASAGVLALVGRGPQGSENPKGEAHPLLIIIIDPLPTFLTGPSVAVIFKRPRQFHTLPLPSTRPERPVVLVRCDQTDMGASSVQYQRPTYRPRPRRSAGASAFRVPYAPCSCVIVRDNVH